MSFSAHPEKPISLKQAAMRITLGNEEADACGCKNCMADEVCENYDGPPDSYWSHENTSDFSYNIEAIKDAGR